MNALRLRGRARRLDRPASTAVGAGNLLLCGALLLTATGVLFHEPTTREEESAAFGLASQVYGYWLVGGLALFSVLGMPRTLLAHLAMMLLSPVALFLLLVSPSLL